MVELVHAGRTPEKLAAAMRSSAAIGGSKTDCLEA
jgi:hypothetical protein